MPGKATELRRDVLLNGRQAAESIGIAYQSFLKWKVPPVGKDGRQNLYSLRVILDTYAARIEREITPKVREQVRAELAGGDADETPAKVRQDMERHRARLLEAQADQAILKNQMMRHEVAEFGFLTFALAGVGNALASFLDSIPSVLVRQAAIKPKDAEKVREAAAGVANQIAELCDDDWIARRYDDYLAERDS